MKNIGNESFGVSLPTDATDFLDYSSMDSYNGSDIMVTFNDSVIALMEDELLKFYDKFYDIKNNLLIILYVPVIFLALVANSLIIVVVFKYNYMRSVTNYFVVNLSVADLLVTTICMPVSVSQAISIVWTHGEFMCKLSSYLQGVAVAASVFTIMAMSIDRYMAIRNPIAFRRFFNRRSTVIVIITLWLVACTIFTPVLKGMTLQSPSVELMNISFQGVPLMPQDSDSQNSNSKSLHRPPTFYICSEDFKPLGFHAHIFGLACFILVYAIPGCVVIVAYSLMGRTLCARKPPFDCDSVEGSASSQQSFRLVRERRRVAWILLLLAVLFALCWLPYNVTRLLVDLGVIEGGSITNSLSYCLFLGHANSALNPIVYCFMTRNFRRSVIGILCYCCPRALRCQTFHRRYVAGTVPIDDLCAGCGGSLRGSSRRRTTRIRGQPEVGLCGCGVSGGRTRRAHQAVLRRCNVALNGGYGGIVANHSPHMHCFTMRNMRKNGVDVVKYNNETHQETNLNGGNRTNGLPRQSTLVTTDGHRLASI